MPRLALLSVPSSRSADPHIKPAKQPPLRLHRRLTVANPSAYRAAKTIIHRSPCAVANPSDRANSRYL